KLVNRTIFYKCFFVKNLVNNFNLNAFLVCYRHKKSPNNRFRLIILSDSAYAGIYIFINQERTSTSCLIIFLKSSIFTRCCSMESLCLIVTVLSFKVSWSTVIQNGVPLASCLL